MSSDNYEYECMRADLLGLEHPPRPVAEEVSTVAVDAEDLVLDGEQIDRTSNGLDELNTIIASTKKKLTSYQKFCGRLGNILPSPKKGHSSSNECLSEESVTVSVKEKPISSKTSDEPIEREVERQIDKLDAMIMKANKAELSLNQNNKLIKRIIRK